MSRDGRGHAEEELLVRRSPREQGRVREARPTRNRCRRDAAKRVEAPDERQEDQERRPEQCRADQTLERDFQDDKWPAEISSPSVPGHLPD